MLEDQRCWMSTKPVRICNPDIIRRHESMEKTIFCLYSLGTPHRLSMNRKWKYCCSGCLSLPGGGRQYDPAYASPGAYLYLPLSNWIDIEEIERYFKSKLSNRKWEWKYNSTRIWWPGASNHLDWKVFGRRKPFKCRWLRFTQKRPISISAVMRYICKKRIASYGGDDDVKAKSAYPLMLVMMMMMMKMMMSMLVQMFLFF